LDQRHSREREATAFHEAGHAVAAYALGRAFTRVSIRPNGHTSGRCSFRPPGDWFRPDIRIDSSTRNGLEERIIISLAGPEAEARFRGDYDRHAAQEDIDRALDHACYMTDDPLEASAYIEWLRLRTTNLMKRPGFWSTVKVLAERLLQEGEVTYRSAKGLLDAAWAAASITSASTAHSY
jgi:ATP-dependent Zn protease